jgi:hypothetical protein
MGGESVASREVASPVVEALKQSLFLDGLAIRTELASKGRNVVIWYEVSILSHEETRRLLDIANTTGSKITIVPGEERRMKVELRIALRS